jgi:hypothetical protein
MKTKFIKIMFFLAILAPVTCQATIFTEDGTISGGTYSDVTIESTATVGMTAGTVETMQINQMGTLNYYGGSIEDEIYLRDSGILNFEGATFQRPQGLSMHNGSSLNFNDGLLSGTLEIHDFVEVVIDGGQITDALLNSNGYANTTISDGSIDWDDMWLNGFSVLDIYGGTVNWFSAGIGDDATLNIYGGIISFEHGFSLSNDGEFNVHYSDIIYVNEWDDIIIGYHLLDDSEFMLNQFSQYEIDQINFVPEPTTFLLLGLGGLLLRKRK